MKKTWNWRIFMSFILVAASIIVYLFHYFIFRDLHHIFIYLVGDIAFLFLDVLLVILLIEQVLAQREKRAMMKKLNMVIGTFFSEIGLDFLKKFSIFVENSEILACDLAISAKWGKKDFQKAMRTAQNFSYQIQVLPIHLSELRHLLHKHRSFLLRLLENPNLLEHERFTDLLWAVFHLAEELDLRGDDLGRLPESDFQHIAGDLKRAYSQITSEWLAHTMHLKESYPFLFSLAARINPFNPQPSPVVQA